MGSNILLRQSPLLVAYSYEVVEVKEMLIYACWVVMFHLIQEVSSALLMETLNTKPRPLEKLNKENFKTVGMSL